MESCTDLYRPSPSGQYCVLLKEVIKKFYFKLPEELSEPPEKLSHDVTANAAAFFFNVEKYSIVFYRV